MYCRITSSSYYDEPKPERRKDRMRSENDYLINLKAEMQIRGLHQKMDLLLEEEIKTLYNIQATQITLLKEINNKLDSMLLK